MGLGRKEGEGVLVRWWWWWWRVVVGKEVGSELIACELHPGRQGE